MKNKVTITLIIILAIAITLGCKISNKLKDNERIALETRENLWGNTYSGTRREWSSDKSSSPMNMAEYTDISVTCEFKYNGTAVVTTTKSYCNGFGIIMSGTQIYNDVTKTEKEYKVGEITVSMAGNVRIELGRQECSIVVDMENRPTAIVVNGVMCELVSK